MTYSVQCKGFLFNLIGVLVLLGFGIFLLYFGYIDPISAGSNVTGFMTGIGFLIILVVPFSPIINASDLSDYIPEIVKLKQENKKRKDLKIRHPRLWAVILLTVIGFFTIIPWFIALWMSTGSVIVNIADNIAVEAGIK